jgi:hypothetical protein
MPINNNIFGVYKTLKIGEQFVLASNASRNQTMQAQAKNFIQGTPKARILDIGGVKEEIKISAPILVGGGSRIDGRALFNERIQDILTDPQNATLPVLKSASIRITQQGTDTNIALLSDGDPSTAQAFEVSAATSAELTDGVYSDLLDPVHPNAAITPTRVARYYDFRVSLAGRTYYIMECNLEVTVDITEVYFLGAKVSATDTNPQAVINVAGSTFNSGSQFPTMGVTGINIKGSGKGVVALRDLNADYDFNDYSGAQNNASDESLNLNLGTGNADVTLQTPGQAVYENGGFALQIWNGTAWEDVIENVDLTRSVIEQADFNVEAGLMTVEFGFLCWVK